MYEKTFSEMKLRRSTNNLNIQYRLENQDHVFKDFILNIFGKRYKKVLYYSMGDKHEEMLDTLLDNQGQLLTQEELGDFHVNECLIVFDEIQLEDKMALFLRKCKDEWKNHHIVAIGYRRQVNCNIGGKLLNGDVVYCEHFPQFLMLLLEAPEYLTKYPKVLLSDH